MSPFACPSENQKRKDTVCSSKRILSYDSQEAEAQICLPPRCVRGAFTGQGACLLFKARSAWSGGAVRVSARAPHGITLVHTHVQKVAAKLLRGWGSQPAKEAKVMPGLLGLVLHLPWKLTGCSQPFPASPLFSARPWRLQIRGRTNSSRKKRGVRRAFGGGSSSSAGTWPNLVF